MEEETVAIIEKFIAIWMIMGDICPYKYLAIVYVVVIRCPAVGPSYTPKTSLASDSSSSSSYMYVSRARRSISLRIASSSACITAFMTAARASSSIIACCV